MKMKWIKKLSRSKKPKHEYKYTYCQICTSPHIIYVRDVLGKRTKDYLHVYYCMECESFFNPSKYDQTLSAEKSIEWHINNIPKKLKNSEVFFKELKKHFADTVSIVDIGCGIGTFLKVSKDYFDTSIGYDINPYAVHYGKSHFDLDLRNEFWTADKTKKNDIFTCIMVLEHLDQPGLLFQELAEAFKYAKALYVSVPFLNRNRWRYLLDKEVMKEGTPFEDPDVHVTHFSYKGMIIMAKRFGLGNHKIFNYGFPGVLFYH